MNAPPFYVADSSKMVPDCLKNTPDSLSGGETALSLCCVVVSCVVWCGLVLPCLPWPLVFLCLVLCCEALSCYVLCPSPHKPFALHFFCHDSFLTYISFWVVIMALQRDTVSQEEGTITSPVHRLHLYYASRFIDTFKHTICHSAWSLKLLSSSCLLHRPRTDPVMVMCKQTLCFFVPETRCEKWIYALALTSVWPDTTMADVIMDNGHITTVARVDIKNAAQRMNKSTKAWDSSDYVKGFKPGIVKRLHNHWDAFFARPREEQARILADCRASFTAKKPRRKPKGCDDGASDTTTTVARPKKGKSKWKLNTQVATNKPVDLAGVASGGIGDSLAPEMWVTGFVKKYNGDASLPYEIHWDTQPDAIIHHKNALEVADLVANFKFCTKHRLLRGYVNLDLLWVLEPAPGTLGNQQVKYAMVLPFDPLMGRYKIKFRSGIWAWKSEEQVKAAKHFTEAVLNGQHATWRNVDAQTAALEETTSMILESQVDASDTQLFFQDIDMTSDTVESTARARKTPSRSNPPRPGKITTDRNAPSTGKKYKCGKTKVATFNDTNGRFPELPKNRTGWTVGTLKRIDASRVPPYQIGWDVETVGEPEIFHFVDEEEMSLLVRHHKHCNARKLINMFCVGIDLLWTCPEPFNKSRLRWVSVMYWERKNARYKILFRDGEDAWATGEELDKAIAFKPTYSDVLQLQASYEEWDYRAVQAKIISYGLYCAKYVGPPTSTTATATASLNGRAVYPQRYSDNATAKPAPRELPIRDIGRVPTPSYVGSAVNPFIFKGNSFAFRPTRAKGGDSEDENDAFFRPETHLPSSTSDRSNSNAGSTRGLSPVPPTDNTTSMAEQAMISLGAAVMEDVVTVVVPPTDDPNDIDPTAVIGIGLVDAVSNIPVISLYGGCGLCCEAT